MTSIYFCGEMDQEAVNLLNSMATNLGISYKISKWTDQIFMNKAFIKQEILQEHPSAIVCFGNKAISLFTSDVASDESLHSLRKREWLFNGIPVYCTWNPQYLNRIGGAKTKDYLIWQNDIRMWDQQNSNSFTEERIDITLMDAREFMDFVKMFMNSKSGALDYEASSLSPLQNDFYLGGIGIAGTVDKEYNIDLIKNYLENTVEPGNYPNLIKLFKKYSMLSR